MGPLEQWERARFAAGLMRRAAALAETFPDDSIGAIMIKEMVTAQRRATMRQLRRARFRLACSALAHLVAASATAVILWLLVVLLIAALSPDTPVDVQLPTL